MMLLAYEKVTGGVADDVYSALPKLNRVEQEALRRLFPFGSQKFSPEKWKPLIEDARVRVDAMQCLVGGQRTQCTALLQSAALKQSRPGADAL